MNYLSCIGDNIDQLIKETVMIWRCIDQWLPKTIVTLYCEGRETYRLQPKDKTKWDIGREEPFERKRSERHLSCDFGAK